MDEQKKATLAYYLHMSIDRVLIDLYNRKSQLSKEEIELVDAEFNKRFRMEEVAPLDN